MNPMLRVLVLGLTGFTLFGRCSAVPPKSTYPNFEPKLASLATRLSKPQPGEWLFVHKEPGQTFEQYLQAKPVRRSDDRSTIYLCLIGEFTPSQQRVMDLTREYMEIFFDAPVKVHRRVALQDIPDRAKRKHPQWGDMQILTGYVLDELLKPERPENALAYVAFTASDLWPGENWNFVFGQASLYARTGVWSIYRHGDPAGDKAAFHRCLVRTMGTATHETGHILTMHHCTVYACSMNGSNSLPESDRKPLHLCPVCLRKLCWNLDVEPAKYLGRLRDFCERNELKEEAEWYRQVITALEK